MLNVICLLGPTASGKTNLSLQLAEYFSVEIVSVDSAMVYRDMDIGTAKPLLAERTLVPHHVIDILDPAETYSAAKFVNDAIVAIQSIIARGKIPLLVGGTMLYFKALQEGLSPLPAADSVVRQHLAQEAARLGLQVMHQQLLERDPAAANRISPNDPQRIQRALEIWELTQRPISEYWMNEDKSATPFNFINIALVPLDRAWLHHRIEKRFNQMLAAGFIEEANRLFSRDLPHDLPAMRCVGYRQAFEYFAGRNTLEEFIAKGIAATRQLAKRQLTWLRNWPQMTVINCEQPDALQQIIGHLNSNSQ